MKDTEKLASALAEIGRDRKSRESMLEVLKEWESRNEKMGIDLRETVTGPISDSLHSGVGEVSKVLINGIRFILPYRSKIARDFAMGENTPDHVWEPQTTQLLQKLAKTAKQLVVGGAYAGDHAVLVAKTLAENGGQIYCFEPNAEQSAALRKNAKINDITNVSVSNEGLWSIKGWLKLEGSDSHAYPVVADKNDEGAFPTDTIDDYCNRYGINSLDIIMLDIEGGELNALKGAHKQLEQPSGSAPDIIFEIHRLYSDWSHGLDGTEVLSYLHGLGYKTYAIRDYQGNMAMRGAPIELVPTHNAYIQGPSHGFNILASKRNDIVEILEAKIVPDVSPKLLKHRDPELHHPKHSGG